MKVAGVTWQRNRQISPAASSYIQPCYRNSVPVPEATGLYTQIEDLSFKSYTETLSKVVNCEFDLGTQVHVTNRFLPLTCDGVDSL